MEFEEDTDANAWFLLRFTKVINCSNTYRA
jgi:hypothetical protein